MSGFATEYQNNPQVTELPDAQVELDLKPPSIPHLTMGSPADDDLSVKNTKKLEKDIVEALNAPSQFPPKGHIYPPKLDYEWEDLSTTEEEE